MRLKQVKLSGFKSFCDPTTFDLPGQLIGVVGPNGCGKSNIIDAVRWVLGESRAAELRGESMQDVIFNGSSERKPAARASVEMIFDNQLGRVNGAWGAFAEISVKRILTRDGQSIYQINHQNVRRRDVHDIFLGTGLGPRAYAIIGQGTINRIIEARPEDLRVFLEEAAGVSRYKERRRETEQRLASTRVNLERVRDMRTELDERIARLTQQAEVAQRYRDLEARRNEAQAWAWWLRRDDARIDLERSAQARTELAQTITAVQDRLLQLETDTARRRVEWDEASRHADRCQAAYYELNNQIARCEAEIRHVAQNRQQLAARLVALEQRIALAADQVRSCGEQQAQVRAEQEEAAGRQEQLAFESGERQERLDDAERLADDARHAVQEAERQLAGWRQEASILTTRMRARSEALQGLATRRQRLEQERAALERAEWQDPAQTAERLAELRAAEADALEQQERLEQQLQAASAALEPARQAVQQDEGRTREIQARMALLGELQARMQGEKKLQPWLAAQGLGTDTPRLWQSMRIEPGWELAVEAALRERVHSLAVTDPAQLDRLLAQAPPARVALHLSGDALAAQAPEGPSAAAGAAGLQPLARQVHVSDPALARLLAGWLERFYTAPSVVEAWRQRHTLPPGRVFVVPQGHWVGSADLNLYALAGEQDGVLARQQELVSLERELRAHRLLAAERAEQAQQLQQEQGRLEQALRAARDGHGQAMRRSSQQAIEHERVLQASQQREAAALRIARDMAELEAQQVEGELDQAGQQERQFELTEQIEGVQETVESKGRAAQEADAALRRAREQVRQAELDEQAAGFAVRSAADRIRSLEQQLRAAQQSQDQAQEEQRVVEAERELLSDEEARAQMEEARERHEQAEETLSLARQKQDELATAVRTLEEERREREREQEPLRQRDTELLLREQAARQLTEQMDQALQEAQIEEEPLAAAIAAAPQRPRPASLQAEATQLGHAIQALGPVNLAALDELASEQTRKEMLDTQSLDLEDAIATLEAAIQRMDQESRDVLKDTYQTVNRHFGQLFPMLFGGGQAQLVLTGDEILDAGVQVFAQPPGKKNSTIYLLSGGEKTLTAIALVFAMFRLNPAPFCLLDEVDAPLDDANTSRYCDMVRTMSADTQFLFITHSKITMELAQQLIGVTMQERGVSRLVAVDLAAARDFAEAA